jgi:predicted lipoprotein with Yx(FWY)xxD motif
MTETTGYGKRPMWQWGVIYAVIALVVYGAIYYYYVGKKGGSYIAPTKSSYLMDPAGMSLYVYDRDTSGVSNCTGGCLVAWPAYSTGATTPDTLAANMSVITRPDGSKQFAWMGKPLYYYANDAKPGDVTGDGVGGVWHLLSL